MTRPSIPLTCDAVQEELASWALEGGASLDTAVEAHCRGCDACRSARDDYLAVVGQLPYALTPMAPSGMVREGLRARVAGAPRRPRRGWLFPASIAAAVVLALSAGSIGYLLGRDGDGGDRAVVPERSERFALQRAEAAGSNTGGVIFVDFDNESALMSAWGLPQLEEGEVYQFWFMRRDGARISAFTFRPDSDGRSIRIAGIPEDFASIGGVWVTREEGEGSATPKGPNVLITRWQ